MAEKGRPWMRWHVTRWRNSPRVLQMPLAAQGAYRNLLDAAWQQGGRLPNRPPSCGSTRWRSRRKSLPPSLHRCWPCLP